MATNRFVPVRLERSQPRHQSRHANSVSTDDVLRQFSSRAANALNPKRRLSTLSTNAFVSTNPPNPTITTITTTTTPATTTATPAATAKQSATPVHPEEQLPPRQNPLSFRKNVLRRGKTALRRAVTSATSFSIRSNSFLGQPAQSPSSSSRPSQSSTVPNSTVSNSTVPNSNIPNSTPFAPPPASMSKVSSSSPPSSSQQQPLAQPRAEEEHPEKLQNEKIHQSLQTLPAPQVQPFDRHTSPFPSRSMQLPSHSTHSSNPPDLSQLKLHQSLQHSHQTPHIVSHHQSASDSVELSLTRLDQSAQLSETPSCSAGPAPGPAPDLDVSVVPTSPTTNHSTPAATTLTHQLDQTAPLAQLPPLGQPHQPPTSSHSDRPFASTNGPTPGPTPKPVQPPTSVKPRRSPGPDRPKRASSSSIVLLQNTSDVSNPEIPNITVKRSTTTQPQHSLHRRHASTTIVPNPTSSFITAPKRNASVSQNQILQRKFSSSSRHQQPHTMASSPPVQVTSPADRANEKSPQSAHHQPSARVTRISKTGFMERSAAAAVISAARHRAQLTKKTPPSSSSKPPHHRSHVGFTNPWPSALKGTSIRTRSGAGSRTFFHKVARDRRPPDEQLATMLLLAVRPDFSAVADAIRKDKFALASIWIGHSTFYLHARNLTVLTDPVWNNRLGPLGPKRLVPPPCNIDDLPSPIDVVILSSACYDHYDKSAIQALHQKVGQWLVPLGLKPLLVSLSIPEDLIVELDWWQEHDVHGSRFVCTPSQHYSIREDTLWCSWAVHAPHHRFFYCGGTGYRSINHDFEDSASYENRVRFGGPPCPVFSEIGKNLGPFDTAFLPIGGFKPRVLMSGVQGDAMDMLFVHRDIRARRSVAHRWGTFASVDEGMLDAVRLLEFVLQTGPVSEHEFSYLKHGRLHLT